MNRKLWKLQIFGFLAGYAVLLGVAIAFMKNVADFVTGFSLGCGIGTSLSTIIFTYYHKREHLNTAQQ